MEMLNEYKGVLVIIPTRNRSQLAMNAIKSALNQPDCDDVRVLVSDNSTIEQESGVISQFCEQLKEKDTRIRYITPPAPMAMSKHWDWAIEQALLYEVNHFIYLTDRMIFKSGQLKSVIDVARLYTDKVVSYMHDGVVDNEKPIRLEQMLWTGKTIEVNSTHLLDRSSQAILDYLPKMLNCIVPRGVLESIRKKYGNVFSSISPDYNFCYRCLEIVDSIIHFDKAPLLHYALDRSNGQGFVRGIMSKENIDFLRNLGQTQTSFTAFAAPIPEIKTVGNLILHEYCVVKQETKSPKFPDIDKNKYLQYLSWEVACLQQRELKIEMQALLAAHGWGDSKDDMPKNHKYLNKEQTAVWRKVFNLKKIYYKIVWLSKSSHTKYIWIFMARYLGINPPDAGRFLFDTSEEAIAYANKFPRNKTSEDAHLKALQR